MVHITNCSLNPPFGEDFCQVAEYRRDVDVIDVDSCRAQVFFLYGGFLKWWYPTTMGFPTKNHHFVFFGGTTI